MYEVLTLIRFGRCNDVLAVSGRAQLRGGKRETPRRSTTTI